MKNIKSSVIICTYRREESLCRVIEDLLCQNRPTDELIVVDQTPTHSPETEAFFDRNIERLNRVLLDRPNLPNARNHGATLSTGEVLVCIDDDLRIRPDFLGRLLDHFLDDKVDAIAPIVVDERGLDFARKLYTRKYGRAVAGPTGSLLRAKLVIGACFAVRRSVFEAVGGFDARIGDLHRQCPGEDIDFFRRIALAGHRSFVDPELDVLHLSDNPGGSGVRTSDQAETLFAQLAGDVYSHRQEDRAAGRGWAWTHARLIALHLLRPGHLRAGPLSVYRRATALNRAIEHVKSFVNESH